MAKRATLTGGMSEEVARTLAKQIENEQRFDCTLLSIGPRRRPRYAVEVKDSWTGLDFAVSTLDFWARARESLKHYTLDGAFVVV